MEYMCLFWRELRLRTGTVEDEKDRIEDEEEPHKTRRNTTGNGV
jgi:hypothetical protein